MRNNKLINTLKKVSGILTAGSGVFICNICKYTLDVECDLEAFGLLEAEVWEEFKKRTGYTIEYVGHFEYVNRLGENCGCTEAKYVELKRVHVDIAIEYLKTKG